MPKNHEGVLNDADFAAIEAKFNFKLQNIKSQKIRDLFQNPLNYHIHVESGVAALKFIEKVEAMCQKKNPQAGNSHAYLVLNAFKMPPRSYIRRKSKIFFFLSHYQFSINFHF